eukprot:1141144-Pelagomonas_calceolata.AAC.3
MALGFHVMMTKHGQPERTQVRSAIYWVTAWERRVPVQYWQGKGDTLAQESRESPPPQSYETENANGDLEGYKKHPAPEPGYEEYSFFQ